mgnify:CR=1 FL=1
MSQWSKSAYVGPTQEGWEEGRGKFTYPNGVTYDGQFKKGEFHGEGTLIQPNGVSTNSFYPNHSCYLIGSIRWQMGKWKTDRRRVFLL